MATLAPYITAAELRDALSPATYMAIFDDEQIGSTTVVDASRPVALLLARAHAHVVSRLGHTYNKIPLITDSEVPYLLKDAELNFAIGMAYDRHPEYVRSYGADSQRKNAWDQANLTMLMIQEAVMRFVDAPSVGDPVNVGGIVFDSGPRTLTDSLDGTYNGGDL
jgi:hypothetical protein